MEPLNLASIFKDARFISQVKDQYPEDLRLILEQSIESWELGEFERARQYIAFFNDQFEGFQIGTLIEMAINYGEIKAETALECLNDIPESEITNGSSGFLYHFFKAVLSYSLLDIDEAREECDKAIAFDDQIPMIYYLRGTCYALRHRHYKAIADYKEALKDDFKKNEIIVNLAYSYLRTRNHRKALRLYKRIVDKFPDRDKVQYNTGLCFNRVKKFKKAVLYFDKAIQLNPDNAGYRLIRGRVLMRLKRHKEADIDLRIAFESGLQLSGKLLSFNTEVLENKISSKQANRKVISLLRKEKL